MTAGADFLRFGRDCTFFTVERGRALGNATTVEKLDLTNVDSISERNHTIVVRNKNRSETALSLTCAAARADAFYQFVEWAHPVLRGSIQQILKTGVSLPRARAALKPQITGFVVEAAAAAIFVIFVYHYITVLAAALFVIFRARARWKVVRRESDFIQFHPGRDGAFARLSKGTQQFSLEHATFDVHAWENGLAVVTDGTTHIRIPIGESPGAFLLFAALLEICGSPDDRLVD